MKQIILFAIALSFSMTSCNGIKSNSECDNCPAACTYELRFLTVNIIDSKGNPVELKDYNVTTKKNNEKLNITFKSSTDGNYLIASDNHMGKLACKGSKVDFNYSLDGEKYNTETFLIGKDCCHIQWRDDKAQEIVVD
jgi:hypothetical protein